MQSSPGTTLGHRLLRIARAEPLVPFAAAGLALFLVLPAGDDARLIRIDARTAAAGDLSLQVEDEVLYREAVRVGLDKEPEAKRAVIASLRARLRKDGSPVDNSPAALTALQRSAPGKFPFPTWVSFDARIDAADGGASVTPPLASLRDATGRERAALLDDIDRVAGPAVREQMEKAPLGAWVGPIPTAYGFLHVLVRERRDATLAEAPTLLADLRRGLNDEAERRRVRSYALSAAARYDVHIATAAGETSTTAAELLQRDAGP